jgi:hypothetical protein
MSQDHSESDSASGGLTGAGAENTIEVSTTAQSTTSPMKPIELNALNLPERNALPSFVCGGNGRRVPLSTVFVQWHIGRYSLLYSLRDEFPAPVHSAAAPAATAASGKIFLFYQILLGIKRIVARPLTCNGQTPSQSQGCAMKSRTDRRRIRTEAEDPLENNGRGKFARERRKRRDRRMENLELVERQLQLSEMPWLTLDKRS